MNDVIAELSSVDKCPYCGRPIVTTHTRNIIDRAYDPVRRKQYARTTQMKFCSETCGGYYQMGCEG